MQNTWKTTGAPPSATDAAIAAAHISNAAIAAAQKVTDAAQTAAFILSSAARTLEKHVDENGDRITALEDAVRARNIDLAQVLSIVTTLSLGSKILTWFAVIGAALATMWTAFHFIK
jgi:hypothetical protein